MRVCTRFPRRSLGDKSCTYHAQSVARTSFAHGVCASYPGPQGREYSYHAEPWRACTCLCLCTLSASWPRDNYCTCHAQGVARKSFARASYPGRPSPEGIEYSYHAAGAMARVRARAVYLHGINTLYHAVSVYTGMHKTLETLETLALRARVSKPVSAVLYIPVYT